MADPLALLADVLATVLPRVVEITVLIALGVTFADLLVSLGAVRAVAALSRPLTGTANLPEEVGTAILTTAASTTAGYGMLAEFRESGRLDDRATLVAVTVNTFFGFVQHVFTFYAPVLVPILGLRVGLLYVGARALVALAITLTGVLAGALMLSERNVDPSASVAVEADGAGGAASLGATLRDAVESGLSKTRDVVPRLLLVYTAVVLLTRVVDLQAATAGATPLATVTGLPAAAVPVVAVFAVDTTNGAFVIAPLVRDGAFTARQAVATMLVGGIVSFAVSTFKRSIPFQYGIWGAEFGSKVVAVNTALKVGWIALAVVVVLHAPLPL
ncbi:MAG: nucleoside recognition protein [Haloarculaceae archaeon]